LTAPALVDHFFRHEYGRLVAVLTRRFGLDRLEVVEDAVQAALMTALDAWKRTDPPDNPSAWLFRVASNGVLCELRRRRRDVRAEEDLDQQGGPTEDEPGALLAGEIADDLLRMLFVACDETVPIESQLVFALRTLCGFDIAEIATRLFISEANAYKRLGRARSRMRESSALREDLSHETYRVRLPAVHGVLYLLFTEGHLSSHEDSAIRSELCDDAIRLATVLANHPVGQTPETFALLALMHLHAARATARQGPSGGLLLLEEQDRTLWDRDQIAEGMLWLARSAQGETFTRYHAEAGIAAEHCLASSFEETRWDRIVECYDLLEARAPSPIHALNRALALAELRGPAAGLAVLEALAPPTWLAGSYSWAAVLADLHARCGHAEAAGRYGDLAVQLAPTGAVRALLGRRLGGARAVRALHACLEPREEAQDAVVPLATNHQGVHRPS
jgi:RNA polymerase sigma-70 factor (ECF subfamily)